MPIYKIRGIDVDFPFEAYDCQIVYMEKVIQSLQEVRILLLDHTFSFFTASTVVSATLLMIICILNALVALSLLSAFRFVIFLFLLFIFYVFWFYEPVLPCFMV